MLMFLLLLFCSAAGHAQLYSSVWNGKLVSPPELQQQRSCILGCQLFTEFSHQQSTLPSTGYSVVSKGLRSQTNHQHTGGPGSWVILILPKARKQHKIETKPDYQTLELVLSIIVVAGQGYYCSSTQYHNIATAAHCSTLEDRTVPELHSQDRTLLEKWYCTSQCQCQFGDQRQLNSQQC